MTKPTPTPCTICGTTNFTKAGQQTDRQGTWQRLKCKGCGHIQKGARLQAPGGKK